MRLLDVIFAIVIIFSTLSVALYILPSIENKHVVEVNAVLSFDLPDNIRSHLLQGQQLFDSDKRPVGVIASIYAVNLIDSQDKQFISWRMNATLIAVKNNEQLSIAGTPLYYGTTLGLFTFDTEFYPKIIDF